MIPILWPIIELSYDYPTWNRSWDFFLLLRILPEETESKQIIREASSEEEAITLSRS